MSRAVSRIDRTMTRTPAFASRALALKLLIALQGLAALFFVIDILGDLGHWDVLPTERAHHAVEIAAVLTLIGGIALTVREVRAIVARQRKIEAQLRVASGALFEVIHAHFDDWGLTPAERDVALLAIRGLSIAEIAEARETRSGTVKAQCAAVYAKAGVSGRPQLLSLFIDELMEARPAETAS